MKKILFSQVLAGIVIFGVSLPKAFAITEAARVNEKVITLEEVNTRLAAVSRQNAVTPPTKKSVLEDLIKREAALQEAKKIKLEQDPVVADNLNNLLVSAYIEKKLQPEIDKMTISDAEAKSWYEKNPEIRTSHIFITIPPEASPEEEKSASKKLTDIEAEIKSGKVSFAEAAQKYSEDPSSSVGGDLEYRMIDRLDPSYYRAAVKIGKAGDIIGPIRSAYGFHLIRLTGKHGWNEVDRRNVKAIIFAQRRQELITKFLGDLRQKAKITINSSLFKD